MNRATLRSSSTTRIRISRTQEPLACSSAPSPPVKTARRINRLFTLRSEIHVSNRGIGGALMQLTTTGTHILSSRRLQRVWVTVAVVSALWIIFEVDRRTESAPVQHLYYLPIVVASLGGGRF